MRLPKILVLTWLPNLQVQYRVKWRGYPESQSTWEPSENWCAAAHTSASAPHDTALGSIFFAASGPYPFAPSLPGMGSMPIDALAPGSAS